MRKEFENWIHDVRTCFKCEWEGMVCKKHFFAFMKIHKKADPVFLADWNLPKQIRRKKK